MHLHQLLQTIGASKVLKLKSECKHKSYSKRGHYDSKTYISRYFENVKLITLKERMEELSFMAAGFDSFLEEQARNLSCSRI